MKEEDLVRLDRNDMRMVRWMCNVSLRYIRSSDELRDPLGLAGIRDCVRKRRLRWFRHNMERIDVDNWGRGRPRKTWDDVVRGDLKA